MLDARDLAVVDHRVDEQLEGDRQLAPVAGEQRQAGGQPAAGAGPADADRARVDAELVGVVVHPRQAGVAVLERARVRVLRRQPVLDRHADAAAARAPAIEAQVVADVAPST